jgi:hypothetical protein
MAKSKSLCEDMLDHLARRKSLREDMLDHLATQAAARILRRQDAMEAAPSDWALFVGATIREAVHAAAGNKPKELSDR